MRIKEALALARTRLAGVEGGVRGGGQREALFILCEFLGQPREWVFLHEDEEIDGAGYLELIGRFAGGEPFEYIFGRCEFGGEHFVSSPGVLIPRYDSGVLLGLVLGLCEKNKFERILEIGFGSGVLGISLAKKTGLRITACDPSPQALKCARQNAKIHGVEELVHFLPWGFEEIEGNFDLIFSNPPYLAKNAKIDPWVRAEPALALFGGEEGHELLEKIIHFARDRGARILACEMGWDQKNIMDSILREAGAGAWEFFTDERGFDRAFVGEFKGPE